MSRNILKGPGRSFDVFCASYKFFSIGPKRYLETNVSKKDIFPVTKEYGLMFFELSGATKLKGQIVCVQKVFLQILWKL